SVSRSGASAVLTGPPRVSSPFYPGRQMPGLPSFPPFRQAGRRKTARATGAIEETGQPGPSQQGKASPRPRPDAGPRTCRPRAPRDDSMASLPRISVVTPSYNQWRFIGQTVESVLAQDYPNVAHIVVDGMSTDETPDVLARYPHLRVIREPDRGQSDAINK